MTELNVFSKYFRLQKYGYYLQSTIEFASYVYEECTRTYKFVSFASDFVSSAQTESSCQFYNLTVAHVGSVYSQENEGPHLVPALLACRTWVYMQKTEFFVVDNF